MAIQMTRQQYEEVYGVKPTLAASSTPSFNTTPAPMRMTRAEYDSIYGAAKNPNQPIQNVIQGRAAFPAQMGGAETVGPNIARSIGNLPGAAVSLARATVEPIIKVPGAVAETVGEIGVGKTAAALNPFAMAAGTLKKGFELWKEGGEAIYKNLEKNVVNTGSLKTGVGVSAAEATSKIAETVINDPTLVPSLLYAPKVAQPARATDLITDISAPVTSRIKPIQGDAALDKIEAQIFDVENNYAKTRKANEFSKDTGVASRQRIAQSNVLADSVDIDGKINTKAPGGAIDKYKEYTQIDGIEGVVRENLVREGKTINLKEVEKILTDSVLANIDGADLVTALSGVKKEIQALALRADELGEVPLYKLQDSKVATSKAVNYLTPPSEGTYRKTIASALKKTIENKSDFNVKEVNSVLAEYYQDISRLENLDGRRVKGGKLGKYAASLGGTAVGMAAGSVGGGVGAAVGGVLGGELAQAIKGRSMAGTFGKGDVAPGGLNPVLAKAAADAKAPGALDLRVPNQKVGAPKGIKKTKEIQLLEGKIAKNVEQQKAAIKAGDFALVQALKQAYEVLVNALKEEVRRFREMTPGEKQGGYIKNPLAPKKKLTEVEKEQTLDALNTFDETPLTVVEDGTPRVETGDMDKEFRLGELKSKADEKPLSEAEIAEANLLLKERGGLTDAPQTTALLEEAKKYKSAEEFVKEMSRSSLYKRDFSGARALKAVERDETYAKLTGKSPDELVTVYRGMPRIDGGIDINDWVTLDKQTANIFAKEKRVYGQTGSKIVSKKVKAGDLYLAHDSTPGDISEFIYTNKAAAKQTKEELEAIWVAASI